MVLRRGIREYLPPILLILGVIIAWEFFVWIFNISWYVLPAPSRILSSFIENISPIRSHSIFTLKSTLLGFIGGILGGAALGLAIGYSNLLNRTLYPLSVALNSIPKIALVPIFVIWFGSGLSTNTLTALIISFFPVTVNIATGVVTIEQEMKDMLRSLGASKRTILLKVGIPRSMPYFFGAMKIAITLAFIGSVMAETVAGDSGIGYLMVASTARYNIPLAFAGLMVIAIMGVGLYIIFVLLEKKVIPWSS